MNGRVLALDLGRRRIGLAVSDPLGVTAQGLDTIQRSNMRSDMRALGEVIRDRGVSRIVVGLPLQMNGSEGRQAEYVRDFAERLARETHLPVDLWDERLTTVEAERVLRASGISLEKRARSVDRLSAVILLESYLDSQAARRGGAEG